jgi:predicted nucleotidyltransferase
MLCRSRKLIELGIRVLKNLDRLDSFALRIIRPYIEGFIKIHDKSIESVFVYGSAASGEYIRGVSDINSAVIFSRLGREELKKSLKIVNKGIRKKINTPLFLTKEHIMTSIDTFPIEFSEMKENHVLIFGEDILSDLQIDMSHIRFVCEEQLKGMLIRIRQAYLEIGLRKKGIEALLKESFSSLMPVFRSLLRLKGLKPPLDKAETIETMGQAFDIDTGILLAILADKRKDSRIKARDMESCLFGYTETLASLGNMVDKFRL